MHISMQGVAYPGGDIPDSDPIEEKKKKHPDLDLTLEKNAL